MGRYFKLKTCHATIMVEDRATGDVVSVMGHGVGKDYPALLAYVSGARADCCFLISDRTDPLLLPPSLGGRGLIPLGLARGAADTVCLYDPDTGLWLCAGPPALGSASGLLQIDRQRIDAYERFTMEPVPPIFVAPPVAAMATRIDGMLARLPGADDLQGLAAVDAEVLQAVYRLAPLAAIAAFGRAVLASSTVCSELARLFPHDIFAVHGLPPLAAWAAARDTPATGPATARRPLLARLLGPATPATATLGATPNPQVVGAAFDDLASMGFDGNYVSLPHASIAMARREVSPRQRLCIVATARNEGLYILDWLAYHRAIGVQDVFLYTNDNDDGSDALLAALARAGALRWFRNEIAAGGSAQRKAYGHALAVLPDLLDYRWALIIDLDEYFVVDPALFPSAREFFDWHEANGCDAIALNWVVQGSAGAAHWQDGPVMRRFPFCFGGVNPHVKSACRPRSFVHSNPHFPRTWRNLPFQFQAAGGQPHASQGAHGFALSANPSAETAWINHYFCKSSEEFLWKWSRNRGDYPTLPDRSNKVLTAEFLNYFMDQFTSRTVPLAHPDRCAPTFDAERAKLAALPGVAEAYADIKQNYAQQIRTIVPMFADAPAILEAGAAGTAFLATLGLSPAARP